MFRKATLSVCLLAMLGLVGSASAADISWNNNTGNRKWCDSGNWSADVPGSGDIAVIASGPAGPEIIEPLCDVNAFRIQGPCWKSGGIQDMNIIDANVIVREWWMFSDDGDPVEATAALTISGNSNVDIGTTGTYHFKLVRDGNSTLTIQSTVNGDPNITVTGGLFAGDDGGVATVNMNGGRLKVGGDISLGENAVGNFIMTAGTVEAGGLQLTARNDGTGTVSITGGSVKLSGSFNVASRLQGTVDVYLYGALLECGAFGCPEVSGYWTMDLDAAAVLKVAGDVRTLMEDHINEGRITGYNDTFVPTAIYRDGWTWVGSNLVQETAWDESPSSGTGGFCPNGVTLAWESGDKTYQHEIFFGTSWDDVNSMTDPCATNNVGDETYWTGWLEYGKTYYWRVDEVNLGEPNTWRGTIWHFSTYHGAPSSPNPFSGRRGLPPGDILLRWTPPCVLKGQQLYYGSDFAGNIVLIEDDFEDGLDPNWAVTTGWSIYNATGDSNFAPRDQNLAVATGSATFESGALDGRLAKALDVSIYVRRTEDITANELSLYYRDDGSNWDPVTDFNVVALGPNDTWLHFGDSITDSQYLTNNFGIKLVANITGGTVYVDDVMVRNSWPVDPNWLEAELSADDNNYPVTVSQLQHYYWRVDINDGNNIIQGPYWSFRTGYGGLLMYYKFDGTNPFPSPIQDDSDNDIEFYKYTDGGGSVTYGESNPVILASTASAEFEPNAALFRDDPCGPSEDTMDMLRLDGSEYTVELWLKTESWASVNMWLLYKHESWALGMIDLPGCQGSCYQAYHWWSGGSPAAQTGQESAVLGEWVHIAVVRDQGGDLGGIYINGEREGGGGGQNPPDNNSPVWIGVRQLADGNLTGFHDGLIDELRIHDIALSPCEFLLAPSPKYARCPSPYDGEVEVDPCNVRLIWGPGEGAVSHDIYFSSDYSDVTSGSPVATGWGPNSWTPPETPRDGTIYYWRIDTYDNGGPPYEGEVWQFTTAYVIHDETLLLHYKLDESAGDDAIDASGHGYHGDVDEEDNWDPDGGQFGGCLIFDDDQSIEVPDEATSAISNQVSVAVWLNGLDHQDWTEREQTVLDVSTSSAATYAMRAFAPNGDGDVYWRAGNDTNDLLIWQDATPGDWKGDWHHFAFVKDEVADSMKIYFDAIEVKSKSGTISSLSNIAGKRFTVGAVGWHSADLEARMDDFRVYAKALSAKEVGALFRGGDVERAWGPNPYDGQADAAFNTDLSWQAGDYAADTNGHDVYFGTNWDEVNDANSNYHPNVDYENVTDTNYDPGILELDKTYFWRVDEINDACDPNGWKGYVWRFKVAEYVIIDDMEDYTETAEYPIAKKEGAPTWGWDDMYVNWTGAGVILQTIPPIHGGDQAMWYYYDNTGVNHSEISTHEPLDPCDWDALGLKMLSLWFYGLSENDANESEQMYVGLEDSGPTYAEVRYPLEDMDDIKVEEWQEWNIPLNEFTSVDLGHVEKLYIGFGDRDNPVLGGYGNVYFDDIRLYPPSCVPSEVKPEYDLNYDCIVDFGDVEIMAEDWLESDVNLGEVTQPSDTNLVGWWKFDEGSGSDAADSSGNDYSGVIATIGNNVWWVEGVNDVNYALDFDGGWVTVADDGNTPELRCKRKVTVMAWINRAESVEDEEKLVVKGRNDWETYALEISDDNRARFFVRDANNVDNQYNVDSSDELPVDSWVHIAGTYDGSELIVYVNGQGAANLISPVWEKLAVDANDGFAIAGRWGDSGGSFIGIIDDVRVYDTNLTAAEIGYIASDGTGIMGVRSIANLINDETPGERAVNLRDFAELADSWLEEKLYPQ